VTIEGYANERPAGSAKGRRVSYAKWLPEGSIGRPEETGQQPHRAGRAEIEEGRDQGSAGREKFPFELLETSREPACV